MGIRLTTSAPSQVGAPAVPPDGSVGRACHNGSVAGENAPEQPAGATAVSERPAESSLTGWVTIVWDDPVNLMSYVTHVFSAYFGYPEEKATDLMLQVHNNGKAVVSVGSHEQMETDVDAMHGYGLWATLERG